MNRILVRRGNALTALIGVVSLGVIGFVGLWNGPALYQQTAVDAPSDLEFMTVLSRLGLGSDVLAAAGVGSAQASQAVGAARIALTTDIGQLRAADGSCDEVQGRVNRLGLLVRRGTCTQQDKVDLATARVDLAAAQAQRQAVLDHVWNAVAADLTESQIAIIHRINNNRKSWDMPLEYLAVDRTEAQFLELRKALANRRVNTKRGVPVDADAQQTILAADADPTTVAVRANLASNRDAVKTAWQNTVRTDQ